MSDYKLMLPKCAIKLHNNFHTYLNTSYKPAYRWDGRFHHTEGQAFESKVKLSVWCITKSSKTLTTGACRRCMLMSRSII